MKSGFHLRGELQNWKYPSKSGKIKKELWATLRYETRLFLKPEPTNVFDCSAVLVYQEFDMLDEIGYLERRDAAIVAPLLASGVKLVARIYDIFLGDYIARAGYQIGLYAPPAPKRAPKVGYGYKARLLGERMAAGALRGYWQRLSIGEKLILVHEPDSIYDPDVIAVRMLNDESIRLGSLNCAAAERISSHIRIGYSFYAVIEEFIDFEGDQGPERTTGLRIYVDASPVAG